MSILGPLIAFAGVLIGAVLSYLFSRQGERRRERWALDREWRERRLQTYSAYLADVKQMKSVAARIAADVGLDDHAPPLARDAGLDLLAEVNMARGNTFETLALMGDRELVEAARALNRALWRLEWFARGLLDDTDVDGWHVAKDDYYQAVNDFHELARRELGVTGVFAPRAAEGSPREQYEKERQARTRPDHHPTVDSAATDQP
ncbi:hypothetical protein Q0Z83_038290 [Actinoplanes sichuanensis]|uniref:Secreted protein n=1 Tax=Actinoplanes sichuanensis TaxID=512349 RepID=A0ABW4A2Y1_9ACTN|nr:hypothetical protein [Actinoplanes sichuanensis]BEL05638.1 hypothetical protein Q0Z83_038290 [Actinoplanes sichuanensis]